MYLHNRQSVTGLLAGLLSISLLLGGCGCEQIGPNPKLGETGEFYSSANRKDWDSKNESSLNLPLDFEAFCLEVFQNEMEECSTLDLHYTLLHPETYGIKTGETTLGQYRLSEMIENSKEIKQLKAQLLEYDQEVLTEKQKVTYDALLETLNTQLMAEGLELYEQPLAPTIGVQAQLPVLLAEYAFDSLEDVEDYLVLVEGIDEYYEEILVFENQKADAGLAPSDASIDAIIESCEAYLANNSDAAEKNPAANPGSDQPDQSGQSDYAPSNFLSETFLTRLAELETRVPLSAGQKSTYISRHDAAIRDHFIPAYQLLIDGMRELKGRGINEGGLAGFQDGKKYYEYLIKSGPASSYSVPELKSALTERMVQDLEGMNLLYTKYPDLEDRLATARYSLTGPEEILEDLKIQMVSEFPELPECGYKINDVPESLESILSPAFYLTAPLDNQDQNVIYINHAYSDSSDHLYTTLAHEGFPGHLYQTIYSRASQQSTPILSILSCSGANEGWATYAEHYANMFDNGLPEGVGEYYALLRSYSLCVHGILDIGIHYEGWDRETADQFVSSCFQVDDDTLEKLWQVIIDNPTNYLEYCGGFVELMEMRKQAENVLGADFSALEFHKFLLDLGPIPFSVTRAHFEEWLDMQTSA